VSLTNRNHLGNSAGRPKASAIIIFLNGEKFIGEAIESVLAQTLNPIELILVDDGSTDGATSIAKSYAAKHPGVVRYIDHPGHENLGMSASRNAGMRAANSDYVAFLDADDVWLPGRLEAHVKLLDAHPDVSMIMGRTVLWSSWRKAPPGAPPVHHRWEMTTELGLPALTPLNPPIVAIGFLEAHGGNVPGVCALTIRLKDALAVGGFVETFRTLYEDQAFYYKMCLRYRVMATDDILDFYRQHPDSACSQEGRIAGDRKWRPIFLNWLQDYLIDNGVKEERLWRAFRQEMFPFDRPELFRIISAPRRLIDAFNIASRRAVIFVLTPKVYNRLRRTLRLNVVDVEKYMTP
jgi:glycosyltransferase involved in cell wall biosynthesis